MANLKLNNDEVDWMAWSEATTITKKEEKMLWDLVDKIEKQEKKQIIKK